jgi:hypothetical protein
LKTAALVTLITVLCLPFVVRIVSVILAATVEKGKVVTKQQGKFISIGGGICVALGVAAALWALYVLIGERIPMPRVVVITMTGVIVSMITMFVMGFRMIKQIREKYPPPEGTADQRLNYESNKFVDEAPRRYLPIAIVGFAILVISSVIAVVIEITCP